MKKSFKRWVVLKGYKTTRWLFFSLLLLVGYFWDGIGSFVWWWKGKGELFRFEKKVILKEYQWDHFESFWKRDWNWFFLPCFLPFLVFLSFLSKCFFFYWPLSKNFCSWRIRFFLKIEEKRKKWLEGRLEKAVSWHQNVLDFPKKVEERILVFLGKATDVKWKLLSRLDEYLMSLNPMIIPFVYPKVYPAVEKKLEKWFFCLRKVLIKIPSRFDASWLVDLDIAWRMKVIKIKKNLLERWCSFLKEEEEQWEEKECQGKFGFWDWDWKKSWKELKERYTYPLICSRKTLLMKEEKKVLVFFPERKKEEKEEWRKKLVIVWKKSRLSNWLGKIWYSFSIRWLALLEKIEREEERKNFSWKSIVLTIVFLFLYLLGILDFFWIIFFWLIRLVIPRIVYLMSYLFYVYRYHWTKKGRNEIEKWTSKKL